MMRPSKNQRERELVIGAIGSWAAIKFSFFSASLIQNKMRSLIKRIQNSNTDKMIPRQTTSNTTVQIQKKEEGIWTDSHTTMMLKDGNILYVCLPSLAIYALIDKTSNYTHTTGLNEYDIPHHAYVSLYSKIKDNPSDYNKNFEIQCNIWLLHMWLCDLRTLLCLYPHEKIDNSAKKTFLNVINNILQESQEPSWLHRRYNDVSYIASYKIKQTGNRADISHLAYILTQSSAIYWLMQSLKRICIKNSVASKLLFYCKKPSDFKEDKPSIQPHSCKIFYDPQTEHDSAASLLLPPKSFGETRAHARIRYWYT